jgi:hypothetical protein
MRSPIVSRAFSLACAMVVVRKNLQVIGLQKNRRFIVSGEFRFGMAGGRKRL